MSVKKKIEERNINNHLQITTANDIIYALSQFPFPFGRADIDAFYQLKAEAIEYREKYDNK